MQSIDEAIIAQGNKIRDLKGQKATKDVIDKEVKQLLAFKAEFKTAAGKDWDPKGKYLYLCKCLDKVLNCRLVNFLSGNNVAETKSGAVSGNNNSSNIIVQIDTSIIAQGNKIRDLKAQKSSKEIVDKEVKQLLHLKVEFKAAAGKDWDPKGTCLIY